MNKTCLGNMVCLVAAGVAWAASQPLSIKPVESIPLSRQSVYMPHGIQGGIAAGNVWRTGCQSRFQWQGGAEYSYKSYLSGGGAVRVFGGTIDSATSLVYTRYFLHSRFHAQPISTLDIYLGPSLGFDNTSIQEIREEMQESDSVVYDNGSCEEAFSLNGPSIGWNAGFGWLFHPMFGLTASNSSEVNMQKKVRLSFSGGFAFNLYALSSRMQENLTGAWLQIDWIKAFTLNSGGSENSILLGVSFAF